jgi:hypothetical protein
MELLIHQLEENFSQAAEVYEDMVTVARRKQESILCADIDELEQAVREEAYLIQDAQRIENIRQRIHLAVSTQMGVRIADLNIEKLIQTWTFHETSRLEDAHRRLKAVVDELKEVTDMNAYLADTSLRLLNEMRRSIFQTPEDPVYSHSGAIDMMPVESGLALVDVAG